ncbi:MAG: asparaginase, partial [Oscillospiraceae bacterium]|nr:asparaginase [Oscillospiraceae bacterium]
MTISLILTGGTICSRTEADGLRRCSVSSVSTILEQRFRAQHPETDVQFAVQAPLNRLSEDLTPADWLVLLDCIAETKPGDIRGMMILHGTDTLHQTAAMLSAALARFPVPVVLVSACSPPGEPDSNADDNFSAAVSLIARGLAPGVWAVYRNTDGRIWLHRGCELEECSRSADFHSPHMCPAEQAPTRTRTETVPLPRRDRPPRLAEILLLMPYNGMR